MNSLPILGAFGIILAAAAGDPSMTELALGGAGTIQALTWWRLNRLSEQLGEIRGRCATARCVPPDPEPQ